jgi:hypothetical protein
MNAPNAPNAMTGWSWIKQGFQLFRKQPAEMLTLFFAYMFFSMGLGLIPWAGEFLPLLLYPVFGMSFMHACRQIEEGKRISPRLLIDGFRTPVLPDLLKLGVLYVIAVGCALAASILIDDGVLWDVIFSKKPIDPKNLPESSLSLSMFFSGMAYLPAMMAFWYAGALISWNKMNLSKALFYSFFAVWRAGKAFVVYALAWVMVAMLASLAISLIAAIVGSTTALMIVLMPVSILFTVIMYCSFYPTYTEVFGKPEPEAQGAEETPAV